MTDTRWDVCDIQCDEHTEAEHVLVCRRCLQERADEARQLLAACEAAENALRYVAVLRPRLSGYGVRQDVMAELRAAIAKARGEE